MARYPTGDSLLAACRAGLGAIVVVEGESDEDDAWVFKQWFGAQAMRVSFIPQNGWREVVKAVAALRREFPNRHVFGVRDRDLTPTAEFAHWSEGVPTDGVFVMRRSCLESYLLEPEPWRALIAQINRGAVPEGWSTEAELAARIHEVQAELLDAAAFNIVVREEINRQAEPGMRHLAVLPPEKLAEQAARLETWGRARGAPTSMAERFEATRSELRAAPPETWGQWVSGKRALKSFCKRLPTRGGSSPVDVLLPFYMQRATEPPEDIAGIVRRIIEACDR